MISMIITGCQQLLLTLSATANLSIKAIFNTKSDFTCISCLQLTEISAGERGNRGMSEDDTCSPMLAMETFSESVILLFFFFLFFLRACFRSAISSVLSYLTFLVTRSKHQNHDKYDPFLSQDNYN